jgi:uncharacterized protein YbjT (DUF2867 family)
VRVASMHPRALSGHDPEIQAIAADIRERQSIAAAVEGAFGVVNAVSLYVERGTDSFQAVHVAAAERLAEEARKAWSSAVHPSLGDRASTSPYIRARGQGEQAVRAAFASAGVVRPAVMIKNCLDNYTSPFEIADFPQSDLDALREYARNSNQ